VKSWKQLCTDPGATYDQTVVINADDLGPMITYGTNPGMGIPITAPVPDPDQVPDVNQRMAMQKALERGVRLAKPE